MQRQMGLTHSTIQMLIILYLFKVFNIIKLYSRVQIGRQILTCILDPQKSNIKKFAYVQTFL
jgi:hypothetical protein